MKSELSDIGDGEGYMLTAPELKMHSLGRSGGDDTDSKIDPVCRNPDVFLN